MESEERSFPVLRCEKCGRAQLLRRRICRFCGEAVLREDHLPGQAILVSFTRIHVAPVNFVKQAPYVVLMAQLAEEVRVTGRLQGDQRMPLTIGDSLRYVKKDEIGWWFERAVRM